MKPESDEASRLYLKWRAGRVTATLVELAEHCRQINPEIVVSANNFDAVVRNSYVMLGMDLEALARVQDVIMIEHYGLPRWEEEEGLLLNGALAIRTARSPRRENAPEPGSVRPGNRL